MCRPGRRRRLSTSSMPRLAQDLRACRIFKSAWSELGFTPEGGTADAFGSFVKADLARWEKVVRETGVKL